MTQMIGQDTDLTITQNLILLEKGKEELLLVNSIDPRPLYIKKGRDYIKRFLQSVKELHDAGKIQRAYPQDLELLNMLKDHRIIITSAEHRRGLDKAEMVYDKNAREDRSTISLYLLLSQSCNL